MLHNQEIQTPRRRVQRHDLCRRRNRHRHRPCGHHRTARNSSAGTLAKDYYNIKSDYVLEVDITPNRADACSHYGVARDLYAYLVQNGKPAAFEETLCRGFCRR